MVERFQLQLHDVNDADIVAYLDERKADEADSKNGAVKRAIRAQMEKES